MEEMIAHLDGDAGEEIQRQDSGMSKDELLGTQNHLDDSVTVQGQRPEGGVKSLGVKNDGGGDPSSLTVYGPLMIVG